MPADKSLVERRIVVWGRYHSNCVCGILVDVAWESILLPPSPPPLTLMSA